MRCVERLALFTAIIVVSPIHPVRTQASQKPDTSVAATLMHVDSTSRLELTSRDVVFTYTARGIERERLHMDSVSASYADRSMARLVSSSVVGAFRGLRVRYPIRQIAEVNVMGATLIIRFRVQPGNEDTFDFDADDGRAAEAFAGRLRELIRR